VGLLKDRTCSDIIDPCSGGPFPNQSRSLSGFSQVMRRLTLCSGASQALIFSFSRWNRPLSTQCPVVIGTALYVQGSSSTFAIHAGTPCGIHGLLQAEAATTRKRYSGGSFHLRESALSFPPLRLRFCWHQHPQ